MGFPLCSPFHLLKEAANDDALKASMLPNYIHRQVIMLGYYVCKKNVRTVNGKQMAFGTWLDIEGDFFDTTHFPLCLKKFPFRGKGIYKIWGKVVEEFGFCSLEVIRMELLPFLEDARYI